MKRRFYLGLVLLLLGIATFAICYHIGTRPLRQIASHEQGELAWLVHEYHLTPEQTERINELRSEYLPRCARMCETIAQSNAQLDAAIEKEGALTPSIEALLQHSSDVQANCRKEMLRHIYAVAAVMSPKDRERYLDVMKAQVLQPGISHRPGFVSP